MKLTYYNSADDMKLMEAVELYETGTVDVVVNDGKHITFIDKKSSQDSAKSKGTN